MLETIQEFLRTVFQLTKAHTSVQKGVLTYCKFRENDKCPPWELRAKKIKHNSSKKTVYYDSAVLKIYDFPIFYFPKFSHPIQL